MNNQNINVNLPKPHDGQNEVLASKARFKVLLCGRRWGKSLISQIIAIVQILWKNQVAYITPTYALSKVFFDEVLKNLPTAIIKTANKTDLRIELITGGSLQFFTGERLDNLRGRKFHYVIIDEASYIPDLQNAWLTSIRPTLTDYEGKAIFISTPRGKDYFYSLFLKGQNKEDGFESFHFSTYDNPYIKASEIDAAKNELTESAFNQEYLAIPSENSNAVVGMSYIEAGVIDNLSTDDTVVYGIDLAKYKDWTVIFGLDAKGHQSYFQRFQKNWTDTKEIIKQLPAYTLKVMDSTGVGDPIYEELSQSVINLQSFKFTTITKPQVVKKLALDIEKGNIRYTQSLANELSVFEYKYSSTGYIKYEASAGNTDDIVMAAAMANYFKPEFAIQSFEDRFYIGG
jgi:phage FluMu gp28-like protein